MSVSVPVRVGELQRWLGDDAVVVGVGRRVALSGGGTAPVVERVSVRYEQSGRADEIDVVAKRAMPGEVAALSSLDLVDPVFPQLIDSGTDDDGPWIVVPFQPGESIGWMTEPPPAVYAALARLHLRHLGRTDELPPQLPRVDEQFLRSTFTGFAPSCIARAARQAPHPVHERALGLLARFAEDERLRVGLEVLPVTLLHGDVYGDNVIAPSPDPAATAVPQLIDWGSARVGPAMLDVMMAGGPAGVAAYKEAWGVAAGTAMDEWQAATGEAWATAVSNAMFVGATAERSAESAVVMLDDAEEAIDRLGRQLSGYT
ncbi:aminoglycoside phosphotransferase family protein [Kribbella catacumbae]|uniref:aminoglycoside phosphotransferase family protein n=1 Tax=Kribbella catacumbae TaxID=460086 RepID=UPI0012F91BE6|nr:aminoglycoside phosphotransferase family protein [Kribbella catacumbae]